MILLLVVCYILPYSSASSQHEFLHGKMHNAHDDHVAFLGEEMAKEFEHLTPEESKRRLRY